MNLRLRIYQWHPLLVTVSWPVDVRDQSDQPGITLEKIPLGGLDEFDWVTARQFFYFWKWPGQTSLPTLEDGLPTHLSGPSGRRFSVTLTQNSHSMEHLERPGRVGSKRSVVRFCFVEHMEPMGPLAIYYLKPERKAKGEKVEKFLFDGIWIPFGLWRMLIQ